MLKTFSANAEKKSALCADRLKFKTVLKDVKSETSP